MKRKWFVILLCVSLLTGFSGGNLVYAEEAEVQEETMSPEAEGTQTEPEEKDEEEIAPESGSDEGEEEGGNSQEEFEKAEEEESEEAGETEEGTETEETSESEEVRENGETEEAGTETEEEIKISFWTKNEADNEYLLDTVRPDKEGHVDFPPVPARPGLLFAGWQAEGMERVTPHAVFGNSMSLYASFIPDFEKAGKERAVSYRLANVRTSIGISTTKPQAGQSNTYTYTDGMQTFTVPETGWYNIYCYGAQGGVGGTDSGNFGELSGYSSLEAGKKGTLRANQAYLQKGQALQICVGQEPNKGSISVGEGSTNGNKWQTSLRDYIDGYATCSHTSGFPGGWDMYRGYPDGEFGGQADTICDNDKGHSGGAVGGGGGGSSYVMANGIKIISAAGGNGGAAYYKCPDGNGTVAGGRGGGVTTLAGTANVSWTNGINITAEKAQSGNGQVVITVYRVIPQVALSAPTDWTNQDVTITAKATSTGAGLVTEAYCWGIKDETGNILWEQDEEGNELFTAAAEYAVSQNGTYACKIRDTAGNTGLTELKITNIDKLEPEGEITADTDWTKEDVLLTVTGNDIEETAEYGKSGLQTEAYCWGKVDESGNIQWEQEEIEEPEEGEPIPGALALLTEDEETKENPPEAADISKWTNEVRYTASQNGTYACKIRDIAGNITKITFEVKNIDRTAPEVTYEKGGKWYAGQVIVTYAAVDLQPDGTPGCGLAEEAYSFDGINFFALNTQTISKEGEYSVWVKDKVENIAELKVSMAHDSEPLKPVEPGGKGETILPPAVWEPLPEVLESETGSGEISLPTLAEPETEPPKIKELMAMLQPPVEEVLDLSKLKMQPSQKQEEPEEEVVIEEENERIAAMLPFLAGGTVASSSMFCLIYFMAPIIRIYEKKQGKKKEKIVKIGWKFLNKNRKVNLISVFEKHGKEELVIRMGAAYTAGNKHKEITYITPSGTQTQKVAKETVIYR